MILHAEYLFGQGSSLAGEEDICRRKNSIMRYSHGFRRVMPAVERLSYHVSNHLSTFGDWSATRALIRTITIQRLHYVHDDQRIGIGLPETVIHDTFPTLLARVRS